MLHLNRLTLDIFSRSRQSDVDLRAFAENHIVRLGINNPGGLYDPLISATTAVYTTFNESLVSESVKKATAKGLGINTRNARTALLGRLAAQHGLVVFAFGDKSGTYQEFFPQGISAYYAAPLDGLGTLMKRYLEAANTHLLADHAAEVAAITALTDAYVDARHMQRGAKSEKMALATARRTYRKALTVQLTRNFLIIASNNIDNPDRFDDLYDASLLPLGKGLR